MNKPVAFKPMKQMYLYIPVAVLALSSCSDDEKIVDVNVPDNELPEWYYAGGELGTSFLFTADALEQPAPAVENAGLMASFKRGEAFFEKPFMSNASGVRHGLGPAFLRTSCIHCHPGYGHGKRITTPTYESGTIGNGCLLAVYNPQTDAYVSWLAGMPQTHAVDPFKAPLDETKVSVKWLSQVDEWGNRFPDGETYELIYPEVTFPQDAVYAVTRGYQITEPYEVRLESTIGVYGTGLLDAIDENDLLEEYCRQERDGFLANGLNPAIYANGQWTAMYSNSLQGDGTPYARRFTYALSRGPLQDGPGANAIWNITNVTRSDRRYHYLDAAGSYAEASASDPDVQSGFDAYIAKIDPEREHPTWWEGTVHDRILAYLTAKDLPVEMSDDEYVDLMVWHRGLAVPAVRDIDNPDVEKGRKIFSEIGCAYCHRPSWKTGSDPVHDPNRFLASSQMPRYPYQTIWPYTDMVQHKLMMTNDIRTGWCRTTPLWGRGLHRHVTGSPSEDRLHDCRARTTIEAIMWHGVSPESDARATVEKFRQLPKADRDAVVTFLNAI